MSTQHSAADVLKMSTGLEPHIWDNVVRAMEYYATQQTEKKQRAIDELMIALRKSVTNEFELQGFGEERAETMAEDYLKIFCSQHNI